MKYIRQILSLFLVSLWIVACTPKNELNTLSVAVSEAEAKAGFRPYSFEYPPDWVVEEGNNVIILASEAKLLKDVPDKLSSRQLIMVMSMNINSPPGDMVDYFVSSHLDLLQFNETIAYEVNGRPAAYREGSFPGTGDEALVIAVDMGDNMRGLLVTSLAQGALALWKDTLLGIAESLRVNK